MKHISMKDIAERLGVSNATVSLVLSGKEKKGRVSLKLAEKIRATAKEMNYQPNRIARSLRVGRTQTIGLIVADISNLFFASLAFHIQEKAEKRGYTVIVTNTNESSKKMEAMINTLTNRQVDGLIIVPTENGEKRIEELIENKFPVVLLDRYFPLLPTSFVITDNYQASFEATSLLIQNSCKKIALLIYKNNLPHIQERERGYIDALSYNQLKEFLIVKKVNYSSLKEDIHRAISELLKQHEDLDGIFFATNTISMLGLKELRNNQIDIQKDIKVVCFDKSDAFDLMATPITYIQQPIEEMGQKAVELLINQIENQPTEIVECKFTAKLYNI